MTRQQLDDLSSKFLDHLESEMNAARISLKPHWHVDHLCYRVDTQEKYLYQKEQFQKIGSLLVETPVNGRLISTFKLFESIQWKDYQIDLLELPAPKLNKPTREGFEHIEVVIDVPFNDLKNLYPNCLFSEAGMSKVLNQELEIELKDCAIKFHQLSLESVTNLEKKENVVEVLKTHKILESLKVYNPLIAGTFPLGISTPESDIDILLSGENLSEIAKALKAKFSLAQEFFLTMKVVEDEPTVLSRFVLGGVKIELFAQKIPTVLQTAYKHFLIEERLLKYGREPFKKKILDLRNHGLKTEPAFGQALGLRTNPYYELLNLQKLSESELKSKFFKTGYQ